MCANIGYKTKSHIATISILIKFYYPEHISAEDLKTVAAIGEEDIREFVELKDYREDATYSISLEYEKSLAEKLGSNAIDFVNKVEMIIRS